MGSHTDDILAELSLHWKQLETTFEVNETDCYGSVKSIVAIYALRCLDFGKYFLTLK
jgi:hypothetical protein